MLDEVHLPLNFDALVALEVALDPIGNPGGVLEAVALAESSGGTVLNLSVQHSSLEHYLEQLNAYAELTGLLPFESIA